MPSNNIHIVQIYNNQESDCSDFYYRVGSPSKLFANTYKVKWTDIINLHEQRDTICLDADILIVSFIADPEIVHLLYKRKQLGKKTVFEINDNFTAFQKSNPMHSFYSNPNNQSLMYQAINLSDGVIASNPLIFEELNINSSQKCVLENFIEEINLDITTNFLNKKDNSIVIGWGGSSGHYEDFKTISPAINAILKSNHNIYIAIKADEKFKNLIDEKFHSRLIFETFSSLSHWYQFLNKIDLGLCVINKDKFNKTRSDVKFLEYVSHGVLPLCSDFGPYSLIDIDEIKFSSSDSLIKRVQFFIDNKEKVESVFKKTQKFIRENRTKEIITKKRAQFFIDIFDVDFQKGKGEYKLIDRSEVFPEMFKFLNSKIVVKKDYNHHLFFYKKYYNNIEKIKYAIDNIKKDSVFLNRRYAELLIGLNKDQQALLFLNQKIKQFPVAPDFLKLMILIYEKKGEKDKIQPLVEKINILQPELF